MSEDDMIFHRFCEILKALGPYRPDPEKDSRLRAVLDLQRGKIDDITAAYDEIEAANYRADIREALKSLGQRVSR